MDYAYLCQLVGRLVIETRLELDKVQQQIQQLQGQLAQVEQERNTALELLKRGPHPA